MSRSNRARNAASFTTALVAALLAGCSWTGSIFTSDKVQYETAKTRQPLEVPPDLSQLPRDERFLVPDRPQTITASGQGQGPRPGAGPASASVPVVPAGSIAKLERQGNQRWLSVNLPPEKVWPILVDFWPSIGLKVEKADPNAGVLETNWAENRAKLPQDIIRRTLGRVLDSVYSTNEQDKYRARIERTAQGTSEIYITHRGMEEVYTNPQQDRTTWQPRAPDPELEAEMLQRLLVRFEQPTKSIVATAGTTGSATSVTAAGAAAPSAAPQISRVIKSSDGRSERVEIDEAFDRAWRRVGLALDRGGFTVEDRDRAKGFYFVRYLDPEVEAKAKSDQGFFSKIFGRDKPIQAPQYRVALVGESTTRTNVQVFDAAGKPDRSPAADRILNLLNEQLR
ncbi:MAG TPA: outer membrane protein assembly factor BamC [Burkholderiaceae bacterium]|jgi:outer membrane protein assembly factor BamC|nr:outer membrane protein assembly factor BamC [Burkholderiaceae bacterium]